MKKVEIIKIDTKAKTFQKVEDYVAEEALIYIFINKKPYATIMCTPKDLKELITGHLLSEGIVRAVEEIQEITVKEEGVCHVKLKPEVDIESRLKLASRLYRIIPFCMRRPIQPSNSQETQARPVDD